MTSAPPLFPRIVIANPRFPLGEVVATANALGQLDPLAISQALSRHACGDWGEVCPEDVEENERSLERGFRLLSVYRSGDTKFWIITDACRSVTTVLMPEDY